MNLLLLVFSSGLNTSSDGRKQNKKEGCVFLHLLRVKSTFYIKSLSCVSNYYSINTKKLLRNIYHCKASFPVKYTHMYSLQKDQLKGFFELFL